MQTTYSTDFTKWDRFFIGGWTALTLGSPSLARSQARRDRRRIGCAQRMNWARALTRFGSGKYTRSNPTWACAPVYCVTAEMDALNHVSSRRAGQARSGRDRARAA